MQGWRSVALSLFAAAAACGGPDAVPAGGSTGALRSSGPATIRDPATGTELSREAAPPLRPESGGPAPFAVARRADGSPSAAPVPGAERALAAVLLAGDRAAWVAARGDGTGDLRVDGPGGPRTIDTDVLPELAVSPDGRRLLYVRRTPAGCTLLLAEPPDGARSAVYSGPTADRPVFRDDGRAFAFTGTGDGGLAALFVAGPGAPAHQLTNVGLRAGRGIPAGFVPPPATADGLTFTAEAIRYRAAGGLCRVDPASGAARCTEDAP